MKNKYITLDYQEYLYLLKQLEKVEKLVNKIYENVDDRTKKKIENYLIKNEMWIKNK